MHSVEVEAGYRALLGKFELLAQLDDEDRHALRSIPIEIDEVSAGEHLVREGVETPYCCLLVSGYACRYKSAPDGGRQIVSFHVPGDILALERVMILLADHSVETITPSVVAWLASDSIRHLAGKHPAIRDALWRDTLIEASIFREWVLNVGRRDAKARIAHMLCEFAMRHAVAGLGGPERIALPLNQNHIAEATGLAPVHVNRTLRELDNDGIVVRNEGYPTITAWDRMQEVAGFDARYLHAAA